MKAIIFFTLVTLGFNAHAIMVIEPADDGSEDIVHADVVQAVACPNFVGCELQSIGESWPESLTDRLIDSISNHSVVNMSFGFQAPSSSMSTHRAVTNSDPNELSYDEQLRNYYDRREGLELLFVQRPEALFIAAAGNGYSINGLVTDGVPLIRRYATYPAFMTFDNVLKVTSIDSTEVKESDLNTYKIDSYANYSVELVDLAAPVETLTENIKGTSFAAPFVARLADRAFKRNLLKSEVKELLYKSSHVQGLESAIALTEEYLEDRENSTIFKIENERKKADRDQMISEIHPVLLVKSGGPVVESVFNRCLENYENLGLTIEDACLQAQVEVLNADQNRVEDLKRFWSLRGL